MLRLLALVCLGLILTTSSLNGIFASPLTKSSLHKRESPAGKRQPSSRPESQTGTTQPSFGVADNAMPHLALPFVDANLVADPLLRQVLLTYHHLHHHRPAPVLQGVRAVGQQPTKDTAGVPEEEMDLEYELMPQDATKDMETFIVALRHYLQSLTPSRRNDFVNAYLAHADDDDAYAIQRAMDKDAIGRINVRRNGNEEHLANGVRSPSARLMSAMKQVRQRSEQLSSVLQTISPEEVLEMADGYLAHGEKSEVLALQHAFSLLQSQVCHPPIGHGTRACHFHGQPTVQHDQARQRLTLSLLTGDMSQDEMVAFLPVFLEHAGPHDVQNLKHLLHMGSGNKTAVENDPGQEVRAQNASSVENDPAGVSSLSLDSDREQGNEMSAERQQEKHTADSAAKKALRKRTSISTSGVHVRLHGQTVNHSDASPSDRSMVRRSAPPPPANSDGDLGLHLPDQPQRRVAHSHPVILLRRTASPSPTHYLIPKLEHVQDVSAPNRQEMGEYDLTGRRPHSL